MDNYKRLCFSLFASLTLTGQIAYADELFCPEGAGTEITMAMGDNVYCKSDGSNEVDLFYFLGKIGDNVEIFLQDGGERGTYRPVLFDPGGVPVDDDCCSNPILKKVLEKDGLYTLRVLQNDPPPPGTSIPYLIQFPCVQQDCQTEIPPDSLGYHAVDSCRIVDTRYGIGGSMSAGDVRHFRTYGDVSAQNSAAGGAPLDYPTQCPFALGEHAAVHLSITVTPLGPKGENGSIKVGPYGQSLPNFPWVYYKKSGAQKYINTGTVKVKSSTKSTPEISVSTTKDVHLQIDVLGYYTE